MAEQALSRRGFLAATGCVAATVAAGYSGFSDWQKAYAAKGDDGLVMAGHSACNGCFSKCGYSAYTKDGRLNKIVGDAAHPYGKGKLCARGYGYSQIVYNENRLTDPLRRTSDGKFEKITWDEAYSVNSAKVKQIIKESGPSALALIETGVVVTDFYAKRFLTALGSANTYTHGAACNLARNSGLAWSVGGAWGTDFGNAKCVMFIGRSYADGVRPGSLAGMKAGHDKGAYIVMVDPRYNNSMNFVDEWVPINPGTDLAFVLAMSNYIITNDLYDHEFIENYTEGFDEWAQAIRTYTPEWAAKITGIDKDTIIRLAKMFAENAPKASIESGWRGATGVSYFNSGECARAIALFNAILGNYNRKGGSMFAPGIGFGKLEDPKFAAPPAASGSQLGHAELPLAITSMGSNIFLAQQIEKGKVRGMFFCQSNMAFGYSNPAKLAEILG
ncbi:MAG: molybdopterin-dependent oxidoreductase, partial [Eggerthellaceae bacterium]|nr:molybdopterin-dependent oxidoreductase [Eggerthellaceae bacterium]